MDFSAPLTIIVTFAVIIWGILFLGGDLMSFLDLSSVLITVVPTFCSILCAFPISQLAQMPKHVGIILGRQKFDPLHYINIITDLAEKARAQGLLALESESANIDDKFVKSAILMVADAVDPEVVEMRLNATLDAMTERHSKSWAIYDRGASFGPAYGMVGTIVSLINMLQNLDFADAGGVKSLGVNMSAALVTTLYGSLLANVFFMPLGARLRFMHQKEVDCKTIVVDGVLAIQQGMNPKIIKEMLLERIDPAVVAKISNE